MFAVCFVEAQAVFDNVQHLILVINTGQFGCQLRVPAELAAKLDPKSLFAFNNSSGGARGYALTAIKTSDIVNDRTIVR